MGKSQCRDKDQGPHIFLIQSQSSRVEFQNSTQKEAFLWWLAGMDGGVKISVMRSKIKRKAILHEL